ncbi:IclR family transcriptional regulator [Microcella putealis]|uniref:IclR family transcriptional regulator n=1 Tax=Microcella putealis TaxID=337005 RepID=A0A4Q7LY59_9MICO|nr:IclR family transcriptional regulator C-terminal domain-containing protein [Microcella putealis]RZS59407.1 IclR family transcriptional regulator [Microcella putealis]TQM20032.1 IclR family transcriptional regulator [Microcella putealis]
MTDSDAPDRPADFVQSLERGLHVIRSFSADKPVMTLSEVARRTGLTRAAARRFLITLQHLGYVANDGGQFSLRPAVLQLGYAYLSSLSLAEIASEHLRLAGEELHESCSASVLDGDSIVYIARAPTARIMSINLAVGTRLPAVLTSMGRVMLAALSDDELDRLLATATLDRRTSSTITRRAALRDEINLVRERGWSIVDQELEIGVRSIAVPIRDTRGVVVAAINASAHASRVEIDELQTRFLARLQRAAAEITDDLRARR